MCGVKFFATFFWNLSKEHLCFFFLFFKKKQQLNVWYSYYVVQGCNKEGVGHFSQVTSNSRRGNGPRLHEGTFKLDIRKNSFTKTVVRPWDSLHREVVESPCLELSKTHVDVAFGAQFSDEHGSIS